MTVWSRRYLESVRRGRPDGAGERVVVWVCSLNGFFLDPAWTLGGDGA